MQIYVHEQGAVVRKKGGLLLITKKRKKLKELPLMKIDQLVLVGNVQLTTQAAKYMLDQDIDVVFMTTRWRYVGRLDKTESKFSEVRRKQVRLTDNSQRSLEVARQVIEGKINNQRVVLYRRAQEDPHAATALTGMMAMLQRCKEATTLDQLRGFEGKAAAFYFDGVRTFFPQEWGFEKRQYYPPPDPANALLSYCYTLLLKDVKAALHIVGLDPAFGFFHALADNRPSLALDMMEEFRPSVSDIVVLSLVMDKHITLDDFERTGNAGLPVKLTKAAEEVLINAYEQRMAQEIFHPMANGNTPYRSAIGYQARQMRWIAEGKAVDYAPIELR